MDELEAKLNDVMTEGIKAYLDSSVEDWDKIREGISNDFYKALVELIIGIYNEGIHKEDNKL